MLQIPQPWLTDCLLSVNSLSSFFNLSHILQVEHLCFSFVFCFFFKTGSILINLQSLTSKCLLPFSTQHTSLCRNTWRRAITADWLSTFTVADVLRNLQSRFQVNHIKTSPQFLSQSVSRTSLIAHRWVVTWQAGEDANRKWGTWRLCSATIKASRQGGRHGAPSAAVRTLPRCSHSLSRNIFFFLSSNNEMAVKLHPHRSM